MQNNINPTSPQSNQKPSSSSIPSKSTSPQYINNYEILSRIGAGSFGLVYKVRRSSSPTIKVIKQIPFTSDDPNDPDSTDDNQLKEAKNEANILSELTNKYVVKYYESFEENNNLDIVMEYCENGDLSTYIQKLKKNKIKNLPEAQIWKFFIQLSLGLAYIHHKKILHRDLKSLNIFLSKNLDVKIGDFGVGKILENTLHARTFIGTPYYLSPEILEEKPYNEKSDVWALGCILYELIMFKHPYNASNQAALFLKIKNSNFEPITHNYSNDLKKFVGLLLDKNYNSRPTMKQIIENSTFEEKAKVFGCLNDRNEILKLYNKGGNSNNMCCANNNSCANNNNGSYNTNSSVILNGKRTNAKGSINSAHSNSSKGPNIKKEVQPKKSGSHINTYISNGSLPNNVDPNKEKKLFLLKEDKLHININQNKNKKKSPNKSEINSANKLLLLKKNSMVIPYSTNTSNVNNDNNNNKNIINLKSSNISMNNIPIHPQNSSQLRYDQYVKSSGNNNNLNQKNTNINTSQENSRLTYCANSSKKPQSNYKNKGLSGKIRSNSNLFSHNNFYNRIPSIHHHSNSKNKNAKNYKISSDRNSRGSSGNKNKSKNLNSGSGSKNIIPPNNISSAGALLNNKLKNNSNIKNKPSILNNNSQSSQKRLNDFFENKEKLKDKINLNDLKLNMNINVTSNITSNITSNSSIINSCIISNDREHDSKPEIKHYETPKTKSKNPILNQANSKNNVVQGLRKKYDYILNSESNKRNSAKIIHNRNDRPNSISKKNSLGSYNTNTHITSCKKNLNFKNLLAHKGHSTEKKEINSVLKKININENEIRNQDLEELDKFIEEMNQENNNVLDSIRKEKDKNNLNMHNMNGYQDKDSFKMNYNNNNMQMQICDIINNSCNKNPGNFFNSAVCTSGNSGRNLINGNKAHFRLRSNNNEGLKGGKKIIIQGVSNSSSKRLLSERKINSKPNSKSKGKIINSFSKEKINNENSSNNLKIKEKNLDSNKDNLNLNSNPNTANIISTTNIINITNGTNKNEDFPIITNNSYTNQNSNSNNAFSTNNQNISMEISYEKNYENKKIDKIEVVNKDEEGIEASNSSIDIDRSKSDSGDEDEIVSVVKGKGTIKNEIANK